MKQLKIDIRILLCLCLVFMIVGAMGWALISRPEIVVNTITQPDTTMIRRNDSLTRANRELRSDLACRKSDTFRIHDTTFLIGPDSPFGEIPVRRDEFRDSLPVNTADGRQYIRFDLGIIFRGICSGYDIRTVPRPFTIKTKQPSAFRFEGGIGLNTSIKPSDLDPIGVLGIGASFKHFRLLGIGWLGPNVPGWIQPRLEAGWCL